MREQVLWQRWDEAARDPLFRRDLADVEPEIVAAIDSRVQRRIDSGSGREEAHGGTGPTVAVGRSLMTAEELSRLPDDGLRRELVRGELHTVPPSGFEHGDVTAEIGASLRVYARAHHLGRVVVGDVGFLLTTEPDTVRAPDVAFVRRDRLGDGDLVGGYWPGAPDLVVEVISPHDLYTEVDEKIAEWLAGGARLVFVVNPRRRTVAVHRPDQPVSTLGENDLLDGEDVVPGWSLPVRDLFSPR